MRAIVESVFTRGDDVWVWDMGGRRYLDAAAGFAGCNAGHGRTAIVRAIGGQLHRRASDGPAKELAERLAAMAPMRDPWVWFGDPGRLDCFDARQTAFGRLGTWFGVERSGARPDLILFGDSVTSGYLPLTGLIGSGQLEPPPFRPVHGAPCAAALANLDILEAEALIPRGAALEGDLFDALRQLEPHPLVARVRGGVGLHGTVTLTHGDGGRLADLTRAGGVLVEPTADGVAVSPPLTATADQFELIVEALSQALDEMGVVGLGSAYSDGALPG